MSDEFDDLKRAFDAATPLPDQAAKARNTARAAEIFAARQETAPEPRPTSESGNRSRFVNGVKAMLNGLTSRGGLTATTALVSVAVVMVTPAGRDIWSPRSLTDIEVGIGAESTVVPTREQVDRRVATDAAPSELVEAAPEPRPRVVQSPLTPEPQADMVREGLVTQNMRAAPLAEEQTATSSLGAKRVAAPDGVALDAPVLAPDANSETFANADVSPVKVTIDAPVSTFSIDVDTASYSVVRSSLNRGQLPPDAAVRVEEMINYIPYSYPAPTGTVPFSTTISVVETPWNAGTNLVHIGLQGTLPAIEDRPPLNLVFLIDTSGSMQDVTKLPLLKQSFRLMLAELRPEDEVAIVTYAGSAGEVLAPTPASNRGAILEALDRLEAGGGTAGAAGITQAYRVADGMSADGEIGRVILATDGDFNVGISDPQALEDLIAEQRDSGTYLSVLGFGRGNLDDATMQALAQNGNGQAAYIDTLSEARKVLVDQLTGALFPIANDVKLQVEFNPAEIAEYRLIGYETRALRREDFANDRVDAGDIGAGHSVTAIYEVTPVGSDAVLNGSLRYASPPATENGSDELGFFKLRYKLPGRSESILLTTPIEKTMGAETADVRFSVAMSGFGQLLRAGEYLGDWGWSDAIALASSARGDDAFGYRAEAIDLMRLAEALSR